jgi:glycosyltransferase involved in cell wall biosynthesis
VSPATAAPPARTGPAFVAVVVPCRNEARSIEGLLHGLDAQTRAPDQIVIVDDGSTDDTAAVVDRWASAHPRLSIAVVRTQGRGAAAAMNTGIASTAADVIVRLDGHCLPAADYVDLSVKTLIATGAGVVGGVWSIRPGGPGAIARGIAAVLSHPLGSGGADYRDAQASASRGGPRTVDTVPFGTFHRELWSAIGGFDESLIRNQDYDFNYRVRQTSRQIVLDPAIVSTYWARPSLRALARQYFQYGYWKVVMLRKFPRSIRMRQALPLLLAPVVLGLLGWAAAERGGLPLLLLGSYAALNLAGGFQASVRAGDYRLVLCSAAALIVLQNAWSAGAWWSLLKGARASQR